VNFNEEVKFHNRKRLT